MKNKPTLKKGIVAASVVAGVAGGLVAGLALGVPGFAGASSNGVQGTAASFAKNAVVQLADTNSNTATDLPGTITVQGSTDGAADADHAPRGPRAAIASDAVAKALGLTVAELKTELQSGQSLADVAKAKGVDIEKVKTAILDDFTTRENAEVAAGEHTQAEVDAKIAEFKTRLDDIVNGVRPAGMPGDMGPRGDHGPRDGARIASDAVAKALGLTADELRTELQSGKSLADVAKAKGVDVETVKAAITADVKAHLDEEVASGEHTQAEADEKLSELATRLDDIVNGVRPAGEPGKGMGGDHGPRGGGRIASDAVAKVLGMTADELRTELQSGKSLADVAKAKGVDVEKVKTAILDDITAKEQAEVAAGEHTQAEVDQKLADVKARLDDIVNGVRPAGMPGDMGPRGGHGPRGGMHGDRDGDMGAQGGSAPTLQGDVQVQPSSANA
ncbi:MAG: hypothetical protein KJS66_10565 [Acidobacteria bacterium]|nr:hypothetical protein [Acidobacteriota bacterium]